MADGTMMMIKTVSIKYVGRAVNYRAATKLSMLELRSSRNLSNLVLFLPALQEVARVLFIARRRCRRRRRDHDFRTHLTLQSRCRRKTSYRARPSPSALVRIYT